MGASKDVGTTPSIDLELICTWKISTLSHVREMYILLIKINVAISAYIVHDFYAGELSGCEWTRQHIYTASG